MLPFPVPDPERATRLADRVERDRPDVGVARALGGRRRRTLELDEGLGHPLLPDEREAERVVEPGVPRRGDEASAKSRLGFTLLPLTAIEIGEVRVRPASAGTSSCAIRTPARRAGGRPDRSRARPARGAPPRGRRRPRASARTRRARPRSRPAPRTHRFLRNRGEGARRVDANREDRIPEEGRDQGHPLRGLERSRRLEGSGAHERIGVARSRPSVSRLPERRSGRRAKRPSPAGSPAVRDPPRAPRAPLRPDRALAAGPDDLAVWRLLRGRSPHHFFAASAAQRSERSRWHCVQAFGVPSATERSGRGTRKL